MNAFILCRQSSGDQLESLSIDSQKSECEELCKAKGIHIVDTFCDYDTSGRLFPTGFEALAAIDTVYQQFVSETGKTGFRKGLGKALSRLDEVDLLVCWDITRLFRPLNGSFLGNLVVQQLMKHNVKVLSVKEGLQDFSSFQTQLITGLQSSIASNQLLMNREKSKKVFKLLRESGEWSHKLSKVFGYRPTGRKHEVEIVPHRAEIVRKVFELFLQGEKYTGIAKKVNYLLESDKTAFKLWRSQFNRMIKNPIYAGYYKLKDGTLVKAKPLIGKEIITFETWKKTQEMIKLRDHTPFRTKKNFLPLSGKFKCGYCGHNISITSGGRNGHIELRCKSNKMTSVKSCKNGVTWLTLEDGGAGVLDALMPLAAIYYNEALDALTADDGVFGQIEELEVALKNASVKIEKTQQMFIDDLISEDTCRESLKELREREKEASRKLNELRDLASERMSPEQFLTEMTKAYSGELDNGEAETALRSVIKKVTIFKDHLEIETSAGSFTLPCRKVIYTKELPMPHEVVEFSEETNETSYIIVYSYKEELSGVEDLKLLLDCGRLRYYYAE